MDATEAADGSRTAQRRPAHASWVLLIYRLPSTPTRLRATVWRQLKKIGAEYLHDGVGALPDLPEAIRRIDDVARTIRALGGDVTIANGVRLDDEAAARLKATMSANRAAEYVDVGRAAERLLAYLRGEAEHRVLGFRELEEVERDVRKLRKWAKQVRERDYFPVPDEQLSELILACQETVAGMLEAAYKQEESLRSAMDH